MCLSSCVEALNRGEGTLEQVSVPEDLFGDSRGRSPGTPM